MARYTLRASSRWSLRVIPLVTLIVGGVIEVSYFLQARHYVSTDNAQIDGDKIPPP